MYESHFGLSSRPFGETTEPAAFVPVAGHAAAVHRLRYALGQAGGAAVLCGPPGSGKSLVARVAAQASGGPTWRVAFPALPAADLLAILADEAAGFVATAAGEIAPAGASVRRIRAALAGAAAARGGRPVLIVDEAHRVDDPATFEVLRLLLNFATAGPPDLALLLVGDPGLVQLIPDALMDRVALTCRLGAWTAAESADYVRGRLALAGDPAGSLFDAESLSALHRASGGLPRRLNRLADLALMVAYADGLPGPGPGSVGVAARELDPERLLVRAGRRAP